MDAAQFDRMTRVFALTFPAVTVTMVNSMSRPAIIGWLTWVDPRGCYTGADNENIGASPMSTRELRVSLIARLPSVAATDDPWHFACNAARP